jgi:FKBP-type peptidyl-prolyl cis-trans isomerase
MRFLSVLLVVALWLPTSCSDESNGPVFDPVKQAADDEETLQAWFTARNLKDSVTRTPSGLYYRITRPVPAAQAGQPEYALITRGKKVFVRYEGRLLNDTLFDSNLNSATGFSFVAGNQTVIRAWEEGLLFFRKGEEGWLYSPSGLAYGNTTQGKIPRNACLRFFIRVANVE